MRGAVTSGKEWMFFVYNTATDGRGGSYRTSPILSLDSVEERDIVVGLLKSWVRFIMLSHRCIGISDCDSRSKRGTRTSMKASCSGSYTRAPALRFTPPPSGEDCLVEVMCSQLSPSLFS